MGHTWRSSPQSQQVCNRKKCTNFINKQKSTISINLFILTQCHEKITFHREIVYLMSTTESHVFRITKTNGANLHYKQEKKKKCHAWGGCEFICWCIYRLLMHNHLTIICRISRCAVFCIVSIRRSCPLLKTTARAIRSCVVSAGKDCSGWGKRNSLWGIPISYSACVFEETDFHVIISKHQTVKKQNKNNLHFELELLPQ